MIVSLTLERVEEVADLHQRILPTSPIPCLGKRFMTRFYYPRLLADSHSFCELYEVEGKAVAFISYTCDSQSLFRNWIRRHSLSLAWHLGVTLCSAPQTLKTMIQALQLVRQHREETTEKIPAEILSFGVLPEYRSLEFFQRTRKKIANELFAVAKKKLGAHGVTRFKLATNQNQDYLLSNIFYQNQQMRLLEQKHIRHFNANIYVGELKPDSL